MDQRETTPESGEREPPGRDGRRDVNWEAVLVWGGCVAFVLLVIGKLLSVVAVNWTGLLLYSAGGALVAFLVWKRIARR